MQRLNIRLLNTAYLIKGGNPIFRPTLLFRIFEWIIEHYGLMFLEHQSINKYLF